MKPIPSYLSSKTADNYPSGSTISYLDGSFYVMGDDAAEILVLNDALDETGRIGMFSKGEEARLPKASKADIEASVVVKRDNQSSILFLGSGSLSPYRDSAFLFDPATRAVKRTDMTAFYDQLRAEFGNLNIEAATSLNEDILLGIRANKNFPDNYLVLARPAEDSYRFTHKIKVQLAVDHAGISGMDYDTKRDMLFITFSTEDTSNSYDDGRIGESYLVILANASRQLKNESIMIDSLIKLGDLHSDFTGQKIESVSLTGKERQLLLVADDDQGSTRLFTVEF